MLVAVPTRRRAEATARLRAALLAPPRPATRRAAPLRATRLGEGPRARSRGRLQLGPLLVGADPLAAGAAPPRHSSLSFPLCRTDGAGSGNPRRCHSWGDSSCERAPKTTRHGRARLEAGDDHHRRRWLGRRARSGRFLGAAGQGEDHPGALLQLSLDATPVCPATPAAVAARRPSALPAQLAARPTPALLVRGRGWARCPREGAAVAPAPPIRGVAGRGLRIRGQRARRGPQEHHVEVAVRVTIVRWPRLRGKEKPWNLRRPKSGQQEANTPQRCRRGF